MPYALSKNTVSLSKKLVAAYLELLEIPAQLTDSIENNSHKFSAAFFAKHLVQSHQSDFYHGFCRVKRVSVSHSKNCLKIGSRTINYVSPEWSGT